MGCRRASRRGRAVINRQCGVRRDRRAAALGALHARQGEGCHPGCGLKSVAFFAAALQQAARNHIEGRHSTRKATVIEKRLLLWIRYSPECGIAVRKTAEAANNIGMKL